MVKDNYELLCYNTDASLMYGEASKVVFPENVQDVKDAIFNSQDVVPRGTGSNIVGGCVPTNSVVVDMKKMNKINFDFSSKSVIVEAGVTIKELNEKLKAVGFEFPVYGEGTIGGMIAMNSPSFFGKYGNIKDFIEELEVVNGRAEIVRISKGELNEFCGMEGLTGIITSAKLKTYSCVERSVSVFQTNELEELFVIAKRLRVEGDVVMIRFYSSYFSKSLGFPEKYHLIVVFNSLSGRIKNRDYHELIEKLKFDYRFMLSQDYTRSEDPRIAFDRLSDFVFYLEKFKVPYAVDMHLGIVYPFFNDELKRKEILNILDKINNSFGKYGVGIKRKSRVDETQKKIIKRVKLRHDPFLKLNKGKFVDMNEKETFLKNKIENASAVSTVEIEKEKIDQKGDIGIKSEAIGRERVSDNLTSTTLKSDKIDKSFMDKIIFNKNDDSGDEKKEKEKNED